MEWNIKPLRSMGGFSDGLIAHELAHMWYGDAITCKDWHHIWLNEGFATYGEGVIYEGWNGKPAYDNYIAGEMNNAKNAVGSIWVQDISSVNQIFNGARSYSKGCVVLHMLRGIVGDSTFFNILRSLHCRSFRSLRCCNHRRFSGNCRKCFRCGFKLLFPGMDLW